VFALRHASEEAVDLAWQGSLFGCTRSGASGASGFAALERHWLDATSWVDHVPGFSEGADRLLEHFLRAGHWEQHQRWMYDEVVWEPRLHSALDVSDAPAVVDRMLTALSARYGVCFDTLGLNLYRDGSDSVAWHGDRIGRAVLEPLVATVTFGATRTFALRPRGGGASLRFRPAHGGLIVMGGRCQHDWEHCVPKTAEPVGPRISLTIRQGGAG
jgi:alkylated DNA repair dioxygenase AlkB